AKRTSTAGARDAPRRRVASAEDLAGRERETREGRKRLKAPLGSGARGQRLRSNGRDGVLVDHFFAALDLEHPRELVEAPQPAHALLARGQAHGDGNVVLAQVVEEGVLYIDRRLVHRVSLSSSPRRARALAMASCGSTHRMSVSRASQVRCRLTSFRVAATIRASASPLGIRPRIHSPTSPYPIPCNPF